MTTLTIATCSIPPEAAFATTPAISGAWRWVIDHGVDAESRGRAQDGAGVVRVGDLIEHEHDAASRYDVRKVEGLQRQRFEQDALMHGANAKTADEVLGSDDMGAKARIRDFACEPPGGGFRGINIKDFSSLAAQRLAHRVKAIKNGNAAGRSPEHRRRWPPARFCPLVPAPDRTKFRAPGFGRGGLAGRRIRRFVDACRKWPVLAPERFDLSRVKFVPPGF